MTQQHVLGDSERIASDYYGPIPGVTEEMVERLLAQDRPFMERVREFAAACQQPQGAVSRQDADHARALLGEALRGIDAVRSADAYKCVSDALGHLGM